MAVVEGIGFDEDVVVAMNYRNIVMKNGGLFNE